jgi:hypothetical protein
MNGYERTALELVAADGVVFHPGTWGGPEGYRWRGKDGAAAGEMPGWENDHLDRLASQGLIATQRRLGPLERRVAVTPAGWAALGVVRLARVIGE